MLADGDDILRILVLFCTREFLEFHRLVGFPGETISVRFKKEETYIPDQTNWLVIG